MNVMKTMSAWLAKTAAERKARRQARKEKEVEEEVQRRIQVREFDGSLYVCMDNIPMLSPDDLKGEMAAAVWQARQAMRRYLQQQDAELWNKK